MLKLLDCNNFWSPSGGGVRRYHLEKLDYFRNNSNVYYVFIMHDDRTYTEQIGANAYIEHLKVPKVMGNWEYRYLLRSRRLKPLIQKHRPNVIEVGSPYFMPAIVKNIKQRINLSAHVFGFWHADYPVTYVRRFLSNTPLETWGEKQAWRHARKHYNTMKGVLVSSEVVRHRMQLNKMQHTYYVPLGVNSKLFHPDKRDHTLRNRLKAGVEDRLILFFPHRFSQEKGLHILLKAYNMLCEKLPHEPTLVLAGTGPYQKLVERSAARFRHVHFIGFLDNKETMATYYASADLAFALSAWETFGLSLLEAMSCGLPLLATKEGAAGEHVRSSNAGFILPELNETALVQAIVDYEAYPDKNLIKEKARKYAELFSWKNCFDRQVQIYTESINN